jgi:type IV pilus assembly protein PilB
LVNLGLLSREQLETALEHQRTQGAAGRRLGQLLVELGFVSEVQLTKVLSQHLSVPWVSLHHIDFSRQLLNLVPKDIAEEFCVIPIYMRHERKVGDTLYLAMEDPTHDDAVRRVMAACGMPVKAMIAAPSDIRGAIRAFYGGTPADSPSAPVSSLPPPQSAPTAQKAAPPPPAAASAAKKQPPPPPTSARKEPPGSSMHAATGEKTTESANAAAGAKTEANAKAAEQDTSETTSPNATAAIDTTSPEIAAPPPSEDLAHDTVPPAVPASDDTRAADVAVALPKIPRAPAAPTGLPAMPQPAPEPSRARRKPGTTGAGPRMLALTLLDGTTITIPSQRRDDGAADESATATDHENKLTTRDLVAALRAVANGADADEAIGNARWETLFAALLSLLLRKQLISDWEFVEEWQRHENMNR